ncbi:helix-turn-helix domain-containing protein [Williamsia herbipolensis]|uniref:Helix-turn-helix domain-containing protein n=1 Tax=Williamsia herbipolensis TaxID=1603258 RepID=A0AAU4JZV6_9NOCA|nr:helix-turn-helix domain-containing protein [Williamsia herbipolensis]
MNQPTGHPRRSAVAANVRAELARRQVTVAELATRLQVGRSSIFRRLNGDLPWTVDELWSVADTLEVPIARLIEVDDNAVAS